MKHVNVLLRVVLTVLLVIAALAVGIKLAPGLARFGTAPGTLARGRMPSSLSSARSKAAQPDWGGGHLSFPAGSAAGIVDSVRAASGADSSNTRAYAGPSGGVVLRRIGTRSESSADPVMSRPDYALALVMPARGKPDRCGLFELPSTARFRRQLLPGAGDAEAPAADIPLYPRSNCRTQVGRGTACFIGFYVTPDGVEAVRSFYVRTLCQLGWQRVPADRPGVLETFAKRDEDRMVVVQMRKQDSVTTRIGLVATTSGSPARAERR